MFAIQFLKLDNILCRYAYVREPSVPVDSELHKLSKKKPLKKGSECPLFILEVIIGNISRGVSKWNKKGYAVSKVYSI